MDVYDEIKRKQGHVSALAPMEGVTDSIFRQVLCEIGRPDVFFTEFLSVEGFCSKGRGKVMRRLSFTQKERPVVIQLWGNIPEYYVETVKYLKKLKPGGIDINIGCSVRDVLSSGKGSALIKNKPLVKEILDVVKKEAGDIPISVKTRLGYDEIDIKGWIGFLLEQNLNLITVHGRISKEAYSTPAKWDQICECVKLRDIISPDTIIMGNGDIKNLEQGKEYVKKYGVDGFMIGRAILNNPWLFSEREDISEKEKKDVLLKHFKLFENEGSVNLFNSQKKYIKAYINGFNGAGDLRKKLMGCSSIKEIENILSNCN